MRQYHEKDRVDSSIRNQKGVEQNDVVVKINDGNDEDKNDNISNGYEVVTLILVICLFVMIVSVAIDYAVRSYSSRTSEETIV